MDAEFDIEGRNTSLSRTAGNCSQGFSQIYGEYAVYTNSISAMQVILLE